MARLQLSKSSLAREAQSLRTYEKFLPSLDLKRQQLMAEHVKARKQLVQTKKEIEALNHDLGDRLPMLANTDVNLDGLVSLNKADIGDENLVGTHLPILRGIDVNVQPYSRLATPHWVDAAVAALHDALELRVGLQVEEQRLVLLEVALKTITQRVNLFEKVLIPAARGNIKKIKIYLSDEQMASVVRSKIAKRKRQEVRAA